MQEVLCMTLIQYFNGQFSIAQNLDFFMRIVLSCFCGACIGFERSKRFKEAGIRTHILVSCAAALIMIISKYGFVDLSDTAGSVFSGTRGADPARIAAQVVSGISFLGAGVIYKNGSTVKGLTTAAGIWATAGIGLAIGAGMIWIGLFTTLLVAIFQITMHRFTVGADSFSTNKLRFVVNDSESFRRDLDELMKNWNAQISESKISRTENGCCVYELTIKAYHSVTLEDINEFMQAHSEVLEGSGLAIT